MNEINVLKSDEKILLANMFPVLAPINKNKTIIKAKPEAVKIKNEVSSPISK